jgi:amino acid adenylation domain-containing protein
MQLELKSSVWIHDTAVWQDADATCLHELFEQWVDRTPDAPALVRGDITLSYAELDARANQLARYLKAAGIGPGSFVGLCFDRSELPIIAILASLKAGGAYVPLEPGHPDDRLRFIASEANVAVVLTEMALLPRASGLSETAVVAAIDDALLGINELSRERLSRADTGVSPSDLSYVLYTSGTTGRPKGVMPEHRNVVHFVRAFNEVCTTTSKDRIYQGFALGFDGSTEEIWMAFSNGATLVAGSKDTPKFGNDLARFLREAGVTYLSTVPTMLSTMTEDIPCLRQLVVSGEACPPELVGRWARDGRVMLNVYGPTEATVNTTAVALQPGRPVTIGSPLKGYSTLILDEQMQPVPRGSKGELFVGGPGVSRGYLNQPDLTARVFIQEGDRRLYRTGDLVRLNDDGELEFFGRIDGQVKIRGFRVELSEIEAVLLEQPQIASTAVRLWEREGVPSLAAYVVLNAGAGELNRGAVVDSLRSRLPAYMVPAHLDVLDALPMLASGKVDRKALSEPQMPLVPDADEGPAPETELEQQIASCWAQLFKLPRVGAEQDFFLDLGGH